MKRFPKKQSKSLLRKKIKAKDRRSRRILMFVCFLLVVISLWTIACFVKISGYKAGQRVRTFEFQVDLDNLPVINDGFYEFWIYGEGQYVSAGQFNLEGKDLVDDQDVKIRNNSFKVELALIPEKILISIESESENTRPSKSVVLQGKIRDDQVTLECEVCQLLSSDPLNYILKTPTDGNNYSREYAGIWFIKVIDNKETPGFPVSKNPTGFCFEGWISYEDKILSMGRFSSNNQADSLMIYSSLAAFGSNFPGEDFLESAPEELRFPLRLNDGKAELFITLEPDQDGVDPTGDDLFPLYLYRAKIEKGVKIHQNYQAPQVIKSYQPKGAIKIFR